MPTLWSSKKPDVRELTLAIDEKTASLPRHTLAFAAFTLGAASTVAATLVYRKFFKRIPNGEWITPDMLNRRRWIKGRAVIIGDADNFRLYHTPGFGWRWPVKFRLVPSANKDLKDQTIHIRMGGVDAPEGAYFGRPSQPYYEESIAWLKNRIEGKTVYCQLVRRDQYSRIVAIPYMKPRFLPGFLAKGRCISLEMLRAGWAVTYEQAGAEYGDAGKDEHLRIQAEAQAAKRGIWKYGMSGETPAEYKRRYAGSTEATSPKTRSKVKDDKTEGGWLSALWKRFSRQ